MAKRDENEVTFSDLIESGVGRYTTRPVKSVKCDGKVPAVFAEFATVCRCADCEPSK